MKDNVLRLLFPPKCVLCRNLLGENETDLCPDCRENQPEFPSHKIKLSFLAQWTGVWYYKENVRQSILRYKFYGRRSYAPAYGRLLAGKILAEGWQDADILTWVPISSRRRRSRGYDQSELLARAVAEELGMTAAALLKKARHTKPQSTMGNAAHRRANALGAYRMTDPAAVKDKRILLVDDIVTTGATASECAKTLLAAGAREIKLATLAVASYETQRK